MEFNRRSRGQAAMLAILVGALLAGAPAVVWAEGQDQDATVGMGKKLVRGVVNAATGWLEIPMSVVRNVEREPFTGLFVGIFEGSAMAVYRTGAGAFEAGTFFVPVPAEYRPITTPETTFGDLR